MAAQREIQEKAMAEQKEAQERALNMQKEQHAKELENMKDAFKALSADNSSEFKRQSAESISDLLKPIQEKFAEFGKAVSKETKIDILVTPLVTIFVGVGLSMLIAAPIGAAASQVGTLIMWATEQAPLVMGILVSVIVGVALTLPISSAAICAALGLTGLAGGAAVAGCCAQMVGFAVMSYKENGVGGLVSQGLGTSGLRVGSHHLGFVFLGAGGTVGLGLVGHHQIRVDVGLDPAGFVHAGGVNFEPGVVGRAAAYVGGATHVGDVLPRLFGGQAVGNFEDGALGVAVQQQVTFGVHHDAAPDFVAPIIVVGDAPQAGLDAAEHAFAPHQFTGFAVVHFGVYIQRGKQRVKRAGGSVHHKSIVETLVVAIARLGADVVVFFMNL